MVKIEDINKSTNILNGALNQYVNTTSSDFGLTKPSLGTRSSALQAARESWELMGSIIRGFDSELSQDLRNYNCQCFDANNVLRLLEASLNKTDGEKFTIITHKDSNLTILAPVSVAESIKSIKSKNQAAIIFMLAMKKIDAVVFGLETSTVYDKKEDIGRHEFEGVPVNSLMNSYLKDENGVVRTSPLVYIGEQKAKFFSTLTNLIVSYSVEHGIKVDLEEFEEYQASMKEIEGQGRVKE